MTRLMRRARILAATLAATSISSVAADAHGEGQPPQIVEGSAAAQEINTRPDNACVLGAGTPSARPCLKGAAGSCLTLPALRTLRDGAAIKLPERSTQLGAAETRAEALQGALGATKLRADMLQTALDDTRVALASERARAEKATEAAVSRGSTSHWVYVALAVGGLAVGAGITVGVTYALRPAIGSSASSATSAGSRAAQRATANAPLAPRLVGFSIRF